MIGTVEKVVQRGKKLGLRSAETKVYDLITFLDGVFQPAKKREPIAEPACTEHLYAAKLRVRSIARNDPGACGAVPRGVARIRGIAIGDEQRIQDQDAMCRSRCR